MNTKAQGDIGVAMAVAYYTSHSIPVMLPLSDNNRYDLVIERGHTMLRVQAKTSGFLKVGGSYQVGLRTLGGNQSWSHVPKKLSSLETDLLFVYTLDGRMWEIPIGLVAGRSSINVGNKWSEYEVRFKTSVS